MIVNVLGMSSGKDSTATMLLMMALEVENQMYVFADTGHEHPYVYEYLDYLKNKLGIEIKTVKANFDFEINRKREKLISGSLPGWTDKNIEDALEVLHPTGNAFLDLCLWKGRFPSTKARFCTQYLKTEPIQEQVFYKILNEGNAVWSWQGIRRDESHARLYAKSFEEISPSMFINRPIVQWNAMDTFEAHDYFGIKPNPLYKMGFGRVGCMPCVNAGKDELKELSLRFPEEVERVRLWEELVSKASRRGSTTLFTATDDPMVIATDDIHYKTHGIERRIEWAQTTRGGRQIDLLASLSEPTACRSAYGLCDSGK